MKSIPTQDLSVSSVNASPPMAMHDSSRIAAQEAPDLGGILWRYRWAVILPAILGCVVGFVVYTQLPDVYRSTTRLMVESNRPAVLDSMTGEILGGVPGEGILQSQLYSDDVVEMALADPKMDPFRDQFSNAQFIQTVQKSLVLETEVSDARAAQSLVMLLHFDHGDSELCEASVSAFSDALQLYFNDRQKNSRASLIDVINDGIARLLPDVTKKENEYVEFRKDAPLVWDAEGNAINPHRERQLFLIARRSELVATKRDKEIELTSIASIAKSSKDPRDSLSIVGQLLNIAIELPTHRNVIQNLRESDTELQHLALDEQLVPLMIRRNNFAADFGDNHPTVKQLDAELELMKSELRRIVREQAERIAKLRSESLETNDDPQDSAREAVMTVYRAISAQVGLLANQITEVEEQIEIERQGAIKIAKYEETNASMQREIEQNRELLTHLQEKIARASLTEESGHTQVVTLSAPTRAYRIGPNLIASLGIGWFVGLAMGAGLAFLLEKNSNTFRDPDEIANFLGTPVLTHLPFFKGRVKKPHKNEVNPFKELDPYLAVVHAPTSVAAEAIRSCRTSIFFETASIGRGKVIQVTSPLPGDGKSTIAGNLACSIAQSGKRVLAIDCDLRRPQLTDNFSLEDRSGLTNVLNGDCEPHEACHQSPLATLHVMPSGPIPANPAEALTLAEMRELLDLLREEYDFIIIDTPPLLVVTDPSITASMVDGVIMALRVRRKSKPNAKESINILRAMNAKIFGVVINNSDEASSSDGYQGYGYYRYGRYTSRYYRGARTTASTEERNATDYSPVVVSGRGILPMKKSASPAVITSQRSDSVVTPSDPFE